MRTVAVRGLQPHGPHPQALALQHTIPPSPTAFFPTRHSKAEGEPESEPPKCFCGSPLGRTQHLGNQPSDEQILGDTTPKTTKAHFGVELPPEPFARHSGLPSPLPQPRGENVLTGACPRGLWRGENGGGQGTVRGHPGAPVRGRSGPPQLGHRERPPGGGRCILGD